MKLTAYHKSGRLAKKLTAVLVLSLFSADFVLAATAVVPALLVGFNAAKRDRIERSAQYLSLGFSESGALLRAEKNPVSGAAKALLLERKAAEKVITFLAKVPKNDPELGMALAMQSYLAPRMDPRKLDDNVFLTRDKDGRLTLTPLGRTALVDILTASDGTMLEAPTEKKMLEGEVIAVSKDGRRGTEGSGGLRAVVPHSAGAANPSVSFDGARHELGRFDWKDLDNSVMASGGLKGFTQTAYARGYSYNEKAGTVRVLVAADKVAKKDHLKVTDSDAISKDVYRQTGLDEKILEKHGAKVVRVIDNIVAIDVPLPAAAKLGLALQKMGVESRPARVYRAANRAMQAALTSPAVPLLGSQFLPIPANAYQRPPSLIRPQLALSGVQVDVEGLAKEGMTGRGAYVGVIDSGIDMHHADFRDAQGRSRVRQYLDFTDEGFEDVVGHGTHVTGIVGGDGEASDGKFKGMAPDAHFKVAKVFGNKGETDESVILAAMKWMKEGDKVDIINMSLGGPGTANVDPLSSMANQMTVNDNILIVAAAGNEGPFEGSIGSPGNSRYALTVGGVDKKGDPVFFSSRGPVTDANGNVLYAKPDLVAVAGGVDFNAVEPKVFYAENGDALRDAPNDGPGSAAGYKATATGGCVYGPGIAAPRSSSDPDTVCGVKGHPGYRYMSGTSQAAPMTAGFAADVIGYAKANGAKVDAFEIKAVLMEAAVDLKQNKEFQGAGLINGTRVAQTVIDRVKRGIPIGNIAFALANRLTSSDQDKLKKQTRYEMTPVGLLDKNTGHILNTEEDITHALEEIRKPSPLLMVGREQDYLAS